MQKREAPAVSGRKNNENRTQKRRMITGFAVLLALYAAAATLTILLGRSQRTITIGQISLPLSSFTGIVSSLGNICIIFLVVFFGKTGFRVSLIILLAQFPMISRNVIIQRNLASLPGLFTNILTIVAVILIHSRNRRISEYQHSEIERLKEEKENSKRLFEETAMALVTAIDAKDEYSHGHSVRVAEYAVRIAREMGKSEEECEQIYYAGLLHDVGKIGIDDSIINKKGKLTPGEYNAIKQHPVLGNQILSSIKDHPYLQTGAHYHHERYDGKGYPEGLKGEEIPGIARIIAVADAYDAMSSNRSYRSAIPQQLVREEIVKGTGTQFDPGMARIMQHLIDLDTEYRMQERAAEREQPGSSDLRCGRYRSEVSDGILIGNCVTKIHLNYIPEETGIPSQPPTIILFDSLDNRVHYDEKTSQSMNYFEYGEIRFDGQTVTRGARLFRTGVTEDGPAEAEPAVKARTYDVEAVHCRDHVLVRIMDGRRTVEVTVALPDSARYAYIGLTGENCSLSDVSVFREETPVPADYIPRIAEEISYIDGPEGDVPNVQIDGYRTDATAGIPVSDGMVITFHTMSLPTARLIWHCPFISLFSAADGKVFGEKFQEHVLIRMDGEYWGWDGASTNDLRVTRTGDFPGWDEWKKRNREGLDCTITFRREGNRITVTTENAGIAVTNITTVPDRAEEVFTALTGDQCALTNIRIRK